MDFMKALILASGLGLRVGYHKNRWRDIAR